MLSFLLLTIQVERMNTHQGETGNVWFLDVFISTTSTWVVSSCLTWEITAFKTICWNLKVFFILFGCTLLNIFVYEHTTSSHPIFWSVVDGLVGTYRPCRKPIQKPSQPPPPDRLIYHVNYQIVAYPDSKTNRCKVCYPRGW